MELPNSFLNSMQNDLGAAFPSFIKALSEQSPISIRYNQQKYIPGLLHSGKKVPWSSTGFYLDLRPSFTFDPFFQAGHYYVQEASSMFIEEVFKQLFDTTQPLIALDLCAAPGGKSTLLLDLLNHESLLVSNEVNALRSSILAENISKWGSSNCIVTNNDPSHFHELNGFFDLLLIDAPCSGEGMFRKDPSSIKEWSEENVKLCSARQKRILMDTKDLLKEQGFLLYSTCTYNKAEDFEPLIELISTGEYESVSLQIESHWGVVEKKVDEVVGYHFYPHLLAGEGFFLSVLRKKSNTEYSKSRKAKKIEKIDRKKREKVSKWIDLQGLEMHEHQEELLAFPESIHDQMQSVLQTRLHIKKYGTKLGRLIRDELVPDHALALSTIPHYFDKIALSLDQTISYLRKDEIKLDSGARGWHLLTYQNAAIGFGKLLGNRINSSLPKEWRIRDEFPLQ